MTEKIEGNITGKQRIVSTLLGKATDRVPLWLMDSFAKIDPIDPWTESWLENDPNFLSVRKRYWETCEVFYEYKKLSPYGYSNRILSIPNKYIQIHDEKTSENKKETRYRISTPKGNLYYTVAFEKNVATPWEIEHPLKSLEDVKKVMSIPVDDEDDIDVSDFFALEREIGDNGIMMILINTPMVTVSSAFTFEDYLVYTLTEPEMIEDMVEKAFLRINRILRFCLEQGLGPVFRIMGSEQATPPMGALPVYEKLVYKYEKEMIDLIHSYNKFAAVHCHGNVKQVLPLMKKAGVDLLDPVEAPPSGDVEFTEAAEIGKNSITLAGNIQYEDLASSSTEEIDSMVEKLFSDGKKDHKIVSCTGYPITSITEKMRDNYHALIDAVHKYGLMN